MREFRDGGDKGVGFITGNEEEGDGGPSSSRPSARINFLLRGDSYWTARAGSDDRAYIWRNFEGGREGGYKVCNVLGQEGRTEDVEIVGV